MPLQPDSPTVLHITHWKAGSQWIRQVLETIHPERIVLPTPEKDHFLKRSILPGMIYPTLYITRQEYEAVSVPEPVVAFFVLRDIRDTLVSWYFSQRYSHVDTATEIFAQQRRQLEERSLEEGLRYGMHTFLLKVKRIQTSWIDTGIFTLRYEDLLENPDDTFRSILNHCQISIETHQLATILQAFSFEERTGRTRGQEDVTSHHRKGIAGDWQNYLKGDLLAEFKEYFDEVLIQTGYEPNRNWGLAELPRVYANPVRILQERVRGKPIRCWCGNSQLEPFSPDYDCCLDCGSLVCKYPITLDDLVVRDDDADLYGRNYWRLPRYYAHLFEHEEEYASDLDLDEHARYGLHNDRNLNLLRLLLQHKGSGAKVLEIGCGSGAGVALMQQAGFHAAGLEMSPDVVEFARQTFEITVYQGPIEYQDIQARSLDAIVISRTLEHFPDPLATLQHCLSLLAPDGLLLLEATQFYNGESYAALEALGSPLLDMLRPIEFMHIFTQESFQRCLEQAGIRWTIYDTPRRVAAARIPLEPRSAADITQQLQADAGKRWIGALLDQQDRITLGDVRLQRDRERAHIQLGRILAQVRGLALRPGIQTDLISTGAGWYEIESQNQETFRWVSNNAEIIIASPTGRYTTLGMEVEPGPSLGADQFNLEILDEQGNSVTQALIAGRQYVEVSLPIRAGNRMIFRLHVDSSNRHVSQDARLLNFRVFRLGWVSHEGELQEQVHYQQDELIAKESVIQQLHTDYLARQAELADTQQFLSEQQAQYAQLQTEISTREAQIHSAQERLAELTSQNDAIQAQLRAAETERAAAQAQLLQLIQQHEEIQSHLKAQETELENLRQLLQDHQEEVVFLQEGIEIHQVEKLALNHEVQGWRYHVQVLQAEKESTLQEIHNLNEQLIEKEAVIQQLKRFYRTSPVYWMVRGYQSTLKHIAPLRLAHRFWQAQKQRIAIFLKPKLGELYHHPPKALDIPAHYHYINPIPDNLLPRISVVTPSYNQGMFIERTVKSVLDQAYLNLEYIIQDGASTDNTFQVLLPYQGEISHFESAKDNGQTDAINRGFAKSTGEIMAYLNSDDLLLPGTLYYVAHYFLNHPEVDVVYGHRVLINEQDEEIGRWVMPPHDDAVLSWADYIPQETLFWRRRIWEKAGGRLDDSFRFAMDWDLILRFREAGAKFVRLPRFMGAFRVHDQQKTSAQLNSTGEQEMQFLRARCLGRPVGYEEINQNIRPYLRRHVLYQKLYRLGVLRY
jgi:SAM-dependent methyltransferase